MPPFALLGGQARIPRLRHSRAEGVQHARVLPLSPLAPEPLIHSSWILLRELLDAPDSEHLEVSQHRRPDRDQVAELPCLRRHRRISLTGIRPFPTVVYFRVTLRPRADSSLAKSSNTRHWP